jgi:peptidoglycan glycosyltransferase
LGNYYLINTNTSLSNKVANDTAGVKNPGDSVYTTLDVYLQQVASDEMGVYKGAVIVTEVSTGKILAMVSQPGFDPNRIADIWDSLIEDNNSTVLLNRATQGLYPPGSTFKIITALEYLRENLNSYENYRYVCNGFFKVGNSRINCYHGVSHGTVGLIQSFAKSCNSSFSNIGVDLERNRFYDTLGQLMFNGDLPLDLSYKKSSVSVSQSLTEAEMVQTAIGQGTTQVTPIHLHMITSSIANNGVLMKPYVIDRVENDAGRLVKTFKPESYGQFMTLEEASILRGFMEAVVLTGTGSRLSGREYTAAGKTGSAEYNNVKGDSHAWFTGFAPAVNPEICITIIMEGAGSGGDYAVPIARRIFDAYFTGYAYGLYK